MMMATSSALVLILAASASLVSECVAFMPPTPAVSIGRAPSQPAYASDNQIFPRSHNNIIVNDVSRSSRRVSDTSLSMGIRSFIKRKILRRDKDGGGGDSDADDNDISLAGLMESPEPSQGSGNDDEDEGTTLNSIIAQASKKSNKKYAEDIVRTEPTEAERAMYEDTQDRIRRMKTGGMTEEEKAAFLNNALTGTLPKQKPRGPPIRQKIPGMEDAGDGKKERKKDPYEKAASAGSSAPKDISVASLMMDGKMKNEEAKRRYMESITNPDRFSTFSTYQQPAAVGEEEDVDTGDDGDDDDSVDESSEIEASAGEEEEEEVLEMATGTIDDTTGFAQMKRQIAEDRELLDPNSKENQDKNSARDAVESILSMISSNNDKKASSTADADAANAKGDLGARLEQAAEVQEKRDAEARIAAEKKREEEKKAFAETQKKQMEELRQKEAERLEKARVAAEKVRKEEEAKLEAQRAELEARQAAQDEYWAKMLEKEKGRQERMEPVEMKREKEVQARDSEEKRERDVAKEAERVRIREEERAREDPHESEILKEAAEAKLRDRELVRDIETQSAARVSRTVPQPSKEDVSVSSFVWEQQRKKEEIDRLRKLDEQSLRALNSPLPSPSKAPVGIPPPATMYRAPPAPAPAPARSSSAPDLSLASLTMAKKRESSAPPPSPPPPAPASSSQRLNLFEMTRLKKESDSPSAASSTASNRKKPVKRAVRQQVPLSSQYGDDDDDDDDDLMRSGAPGLTVADALKQQRKNGGGSKSPGGKKDVSADQKAKQWGIDMSKFS